MRALFFRKYEHSTKHISLQPIQDLYLNLMAISFAGARGGGGLRRQSSDIKGREDLNFGYHLPPLSILKIKSLPTEAEY